MNDTAFVCVCTQCVPVCASVCRVWPLSVAALSRSGEELCTGFLWGTDRSCAPMPVCALPEASCEISIAPINAVTVRKRPFLWPRLTLPDQKRSFAKIGSGLA